MKRLQVAAIGAVKKGAFHKWLGKSEDSPITDADIKKGLASDDAHVRKMANFARNAKKWAHSSSIGHLDSETAAWPKDFFSLCAKEMPKEFKEAVSITIRGYYKDIMDFTCYMRTSQSNPLIRFYDFEQDTSTKPATKEGVDDFVADIRKIAKKNGMVEIRDIKNMMGHTYALTRLPRGNGLRVIALLR